MKRNNNLKIKKALTILLLVFFVSVVIISCLSFILPNSAIGYQRLFIDNHTNVYKQNTDFKYDQYVFNLKLSQQENEPSLHDCSILLENGIFNPSAKSFFANQDNPNYWPKEDCIEANKELSDEAKKWKIVTISYSIKNNYYNIGVIEKNWISLTSEDGSSIYTGGIKSTIAPKSTVKNSIKQKIKSETKISNMTIHIKGHADQIIQLTD